MFSSAVIVFREVFEIVLIVGIVLAATHDMPHRKKAIYLGFAGGLFGAGLVALFIDSISAIAEGMGQEIFNAIILFTAAAFIGWTLLWITRHAREMKESFRKVGQAVSEGKLPFISLSLVIALAILREGSEIVLFTYGMLVSGQSPVSIATGSLLGLITGTALGILIYMGLLKLSTRHFFHVTSWLLVFLVAGMMSQGVGFLVAAGAFESLSFVVWDSSWLLGEGSVIGQTLKALIGYTARPTAIQLIIYVLTLGTLVMLMKLSERGLNIFTALKSFRGITTGFLMMLLASAMIPGQAYATKKVYAPYVEAGELEIEWRGGYDFDNDSEKSGAWKQKIAVGYGVNEYWFTELYAITAKSGASDADAQFTAIEWENRFQLTQAGEYWADVGLLTELVYNTTGGADKGEVKFLFAKDTGQFTHMVNFILEREFGDNAGNDTEAGISWGSRYRYKPSFEPGFEIYSDFGSLSDGGSFNEQKHRIGPVFYGHLGKMKYDVGYLFGVSSAAPDGTLKLIFEYEWYF